MSQDCAPALPHWQQSKTPSQKKEKKIQIFCNDKTIHLFRIHVRGWVAELWVLQAGSGILSGRITCLLVIRVICLLVIRVICLLVIRVICLLVIRQVTLPESIPL